MKPIKTLRQHLRQYASPEKARILSGFFKTGPGQYGEGDIFIGVKVPETRIVAKTFANLSRPQLLELMASKIHEERLCALLILIHCFESGTPEAKKSIVELYLNQSRWINNWDLVDVSAHKILGEWLANKPRDERRETREKNQKQRTPATLISNFKTIRTTASTSLDSRLSALSSWHSRQILYDLAQSANMWERRIAIVATFAFIRRQDLEDTFRLADILLKDEHDLMHKAVGWMLREAGKRDQKALEDFLKPRYKKMPRTMLRYAIERFPKTLYKKYLEGQI